MLENPFMKEVIFISGSSAASGALDASSTAAPDNLANVMKDATLIIGPIVPGPSAPPQERKSDSSAV
jgi:hypothetical protein